jgi:hypothetical protein
LVLAPKTSVALPWLASLAPGGSGIIEDELADDFLPDEHLRLDVPLLVDLQVLRSGRLAEEAQTTCSTIERGGWSGCRSSPCHWRFGQVPFAAGEDGRAEDALQPVTPAPAPPGAPVSEEPAAPGPLTQAKKQALTPTVLPASPAAPSTRLVSVQSRARAHVEQDPQPLLDRDDFGQAHLQGQRSP